MVMPTTPTESLHDEGRDHILIRGFSLSVLDGPDQGLVHSAERGRVVVGTHHSTDFTLGDATMSRFHCEITMVEGRPVLRDLGSRNGTLVDGVPVQVAPLRENAILTLGRTRLRFSLSSRPHKLPVSTREDFGRLVGRSPAMRALFVVFEHAAPTDATILIQGETGTGKDLAAESIHAESGRRDGPFVVVDCGAVPSQLLESEIYGHERGAFTGADRARPGAFELADKGSLFLDEIGELAPELQPKFLRALESRTTQRLGGSERRSFDVRVIAATNRNLRAEVNAGRFRSDLYYRLAVVEITMPPLRERLEDLPLLVDALVESLGNPDQARTSFQSEAFTTELARHAWPGNIRELRNYLERALIHPALSWPIAPPDGNEGIPCVDVSERYRTARDRWLRSFERRYLQAVLARHQNNVTEAARAAGVGRVHFYRLLAHAGLR
jgi:two-component system, NtrC family, response regulator GlrR